MWGFVTGSEVCNCTGDGEIGVDKIFAMHSIEILVTVGMYLLKKNVRSAAGVSVGVKLAKLMGQGHADFCQEFNCSGFYVWLFFKGPELICPDQSQNVQWTEQETYN